MNVNEKHNKILQDLLIKVKVFNIPFLIELIELFIKYNENKLKDPSFRINDVEQNNIFNTLKQINELNNEKYIIIKCNIIEISLSYVSDSIKAKLLNIIVNDIYNYIFSKVKEYQLASSYLLISFINELNPNIFTTFQIKLIEKIKEYLINREIIENSIFTIENNNNNNDNIIDEVNGWKSLENALYIINLIFTNCGHVLFNKDNNLISNELLNILLCDCTYHSSYLIRIKSFELIQILLNKIDNYFLLNQLNILKLIAKTISNGMQDNWIQVRYISTVAARTLLLKTSNDIKNEFIYPFLLPKLCFNRYYVADGVKLYSQETWKLVMGDKGKDYVIKYMKEIVDYYVEASDFDNYYVRETTCLCIGELINKIPNDIILIYYKILINTIINCLSDVVWSVKDRACITSSYFILKYPQETKEYVDILTEFYIKNISSPFTSIRENSAIGLGSIFQMYSKNDHNLNIEKDLNCIKILEILSEYLTKAKNQLPISDEEYKKRLENKIEENNIRMDILSPKSRKRCFKEPSIHTKLEEWYYTDGSIYLVRELIQFNSNYAVKYIPMLIDILMLNHFPQTFILKETIWKNLPSIATAIGKKVFKRDYLELFFDPLVLTIKGNHRLAKNEAIHCLKQLNIIIGPLVFNGRLEKNALWLESLGHFLKPNNEQLY